MTDKPVYIYVLCDSREADPVARVRYVGRTAYPARRMTAHRQTSLRGEHTARAAWMRSVYNAGGEVLLEVVATTTVSACVAAEQTWVGHYRAIGARLTNLTDGGDGLLNPSPETRARIGAAKRGNKFWVGKHHTLETRAKIAAAHRGHPMHPKTRAALKQPHVGQKISATKRAQGITPETRARLRQHVKRVWHESPAWLAKLRARARTAESRAAQRLLASRPEALAHIRALGVANRGRQHSEAFRHAAAERWRGRTHTEATKAKMSAWQRGGDSHRAKLTWQQVEAIRQRYAAGGISQHQLAREYQVQPRTINLIVHYKTWVAA